MLLQKITILGLTMILVVVALAGGFGWFWRQGETENRPQLVWAQSGSETVVLQNGLQVRGETYQGQKDVSIGTWIPYYGGISLENYYYQQRALLRFDLSPVPPGTIQSAVLSVYIQSYPGLATALKGEGRIELSVHKLTQTQWDDNKANYNLFDKGIWLG